MIVQAQSSCRPPTDKVNVPCEHCGNLERNPQRGIDLTHRAALENPLIAAQLKIFGKANVILANPPRSSRGNRWYQGSIENPSFTITNEAAYGRALAAYHEWEQAINAGITIPPNVSINLQAGQALQQTWEENLAVSTTSGMSPYVVFLHDRHGKELLREEINQSAPARIDPTYPKEDVDLEIAKESEYQNLGCRPPRQGRRRGAPRGGAYGRSFGFNFGFDFGGGGRGLICTSTDVGGNGAADMTRLIVTICHRG